MTQQYLLGELSLLLEQLEATDEAALRAVRGVRTDAETSGPGALRAVLIRALELTDTLCWSSLTRGDGTAFNRQATAAAQLREFGVCAGLLEEVD